LNDIRQPIGLAFEQSMGADEGGFADCEFGIVGQIFWEKDLPLK